MKQCEHCGHTKLVKKGSYTKKGSLIQRFKCTNCNQNFYVPLSSGSSEVAEAEASQEFMDLLSKATYVRPSGWVENKLSKSTYVITSAQSDTKVNETFLSSLEVYCEENDASLLIIPIKYRNPSSPLEDFDGVYPKEVEQYLFENNINIHSKLKVLGALKIAATAEHPLTGLAPISKGASVVIGHNQLQMTTLPVQQVDLPVIMTTTGTVSECNYSLSKQGFKAEFNHSNSAVVIELDGDLFHLRHLNFDGEGFYDLDVYYTPDGSFYENKISAIVTGDEHIIFMDDDVRSATYGENGIVATLKPDFIVRHDVLDCYSVSHHHRKNFITKFKKMISGKGLIKDEVDETLAFIAYSTPKGCTSVIVPSNHNDHLTKWLNECDIKSEPWNAVMYHRLMYTILKEIEDTGDSRSPFEILADDVFPNAEGDFVFLKRQDSMKIHDIEVAMHGDIGANGAKGARDTFSKLPSKNIIGHSHSPGIEKGCYQVGTSSGLQLEYNQGASSWMNTHCLIYPNGRRQLVNIINGKWRA